MILLSLRAAVIASPSEEISASGALSTLWKHPARDASRLRWAPGEASGQPGLFLFVADGADLVALEATSGGERWRQPAASRPEALLVSGAQALLVTRDLQVHAIDLGSGARRWSSPLGAEALSGASLADVLLLLDSRGVLSAIRLADGSRAWEHEVRSERGSGAGQTYFAALPGTGDFLLIDEDRLGRRRFSDGGASWSVGLPSAARAGALVGGGRVVLPAGRSLVAYALEDGRLLWGRDLGAASYVAQSAGADSIAVVASEAERLLCLDLADGRALWQTEIPVALSRALPPPQAVGAGALLYIERPRRERWGWDSPGSGLESPLAVDGRHAYLATRLFSARAFELASGRGAWRLPLRAAALAYGSAGGVCFGGPQQPLVCADPGSGRQIWESNLGGAEVRKLGDGMLVEWSGDDLRLIDTTTGQVVGQAELRGPIQEVLAVPQEGILLVATHRRLMALRWRRSPAPADGSSARPLAKQEGRLGAPRHRHEGYKHHAPRTAGWVRIGG